MSNNPISKALVAPSRAGAIRGYCYWCSGGDATDTNVQQSITRQVRECENKNCALWTVRPWRDQETKQADEQWAVGNVERRGYQLPPDTIVATAYKTPRSKLYAIRAKCWNCIGGTHDPGAHGRIRDCSHSACPIHQVRPYQASEAEN